MLASIGEGSPIKNLIAGAFGILISTVGKDFMTSIDRFTFGINELTEGIGFIPVVVGMFGGISECLVCVCVGSMFMVCCEVCVDTHKGIPTRKRMITE